MTLPFTMPDPFQFSKRVFAHYFYPFPLSINNQPAATDYYNEQYLAPSGENNTHVAYGGFLRARPLPVPVLLPFNPITNMAIEVRMAIARGITGFTFDILSLTDALANNGQLNPTGHLSNLLAAAQLADPRFSIVPMLDMSAMSGLTLQQAVQLIAAFTHPAFMRIADGRLLVSAFNATKQTLVFWQGVIAALNRQNVDIAFLPVLLSSPTTSPLDPISIGVGGWGTATPAAAASPASYMTPILPQQFRPKSQLFWEASNFDTFRAGWGAAIKGAGPYAQIITWSDFSESGQVQPYTDASLATNIGTGFYDLTAYYAAWFLSGQQPVITHDKLYWCHRKMTSAVAHGNQPDAFKLAPGSPPETNNIELLAFLTAPGMLGINGQPQPAGAGITSFKVPCVPGNPTFVLERNGSNVQQGNSPVTIYGVGGSPDGTLDLTYWSGNI